MLRLKNALSAFRLFPDWPVLSFLLLQIAAVLAYDRPNVTHFVILAVVLSTLGALFVWRKLWVRFGVLVVLSGFALLANFLLQKPVSANVNASDAVYKAVVAEDGLVNSDFSYHVVDLTARVEPDPAAVLGRVQLVVMGACDWAPGSEIQFRSKIEEPDAYRNPGVLNAADFLRRRNVWARAFIADCGSVTTLKAASWSGFSGLRHRYLQDISAASLQNPDVIGALLLGTNTITADKNAKIREAGLSHLFVISGLHFALLSAIVFWLARKATAFFPALYLRWPRQKICAAVTLAFVVFYALFTVHNPSIFRSAATIAFYLLAILFEKQKNVLHVVLLSMAVSLLVYPLELFHPGFQLSYLCVLTLAIVAPRQWRWIQTRPWLRRFSPRTLFVIKTAWITWLLNLMLLPLVLYDFGDVSLNGFVQNLWAIPYFEFLVMPIGFVYLLTSLLHLPMAPHILQLWDGTIHWFWLLYDYFSFLKLPHVTGFKPEALHLWIFYVGVFVFFYVRRRWWLLASLGLLFVALTNTYYQNHLAYDTRITQIDVGQGDAVLLQSHGRNILIDAGGHPYRDVGQKVVLPVLQTLWVNQLDIVVLTHPDADHYKGLFGLIGKIQIGEVWVSTRESSDPGYQSLLQTLTMNRIPVIVKTAPEIYPIADASLLRVLFAPGPLKLADNDRSLILKFESPDFSALFTGDISSEAEKALVRAYGDGLRTDYLKVAHHGSRFSSSSLFLAYAAPKIAGIGVKRNSRFGHPAPDALARLTAYGSRILRTDQDGRIQITVNAGDVAVHTYTESL